MSRLVLHAPGVHTGGGLVLLRDLLGAAQGVLAFANLDARVAGAVALPRDAVVNTVRPRPSARLRAEVMLARRCRPGDTVLCFHGMPPLLPVHGKVVVFLQNRNYLGLEPAASFDGRTRFRLPLERLICRWFRHRVEEYIVQTPHMARLTRAWHGGEPRIRVLPFLDAIETPPRATTAYDFVYVADGEAHKNHRTLLAAWTLLAADGIRPTLALTLEARFSSLIAHIEEACRRHSLKITNLGPLERREVFALYSRCGALVFPSTSESFGVPLLEASRSGLPILAGELDYVRDVCEPVQTFDPSSPTSIARAVRRFLGLAEARPAVRSGSEFLRELMDGTRNARR